MFSKYMHSNSLWIVIVKLYGYFTIVVMNNKLLLLTHEYCRLGYYIRGLQKPVLVGINKMSTINKYISLSYYLFWEPYYK